MAEIGLLITEFIFSYTLCIKWCTLNFIGNPIGFPAEITRCLGKKATMRNKPETNTFEAYLENDRQHLRPVESVAVTKSRSFTHNAALAPSNRAVPKPPHIVLAVDDDDLARLDTVMMLEDLGHTVFEANSGEKALDVLRREPAIDLVVTDMAMPHMSGLDLCSIAQNLYPSLRFVLATGQGEASDCDEPALLRLPKPFLQFDLARTVELAMEMAPWSPKVIWL
jgi:CheY-like chemotaxis protein